MRAPGKLELLLVILATILALGSYVSPARCEEVYYRITIDTYPIHVSVTVDGVTYLPTQLPITFTWVEGSTHTLSLPKTEIYTEANTRLVFTGWNDGVEDASRTIIVSKSANIVALFKTQYFLSIISPYGSPWGQGWYDEGSLATFGVKPVDEIVKGKVRAIFSGWSGGLTPWSANNSIYMFKPVEVTANWKRQYWLQVNADIRVTNVSGWYDEGSKATLMAMDEYEPKKDGHKFVFDKWVITKDSMIVTEISSPTASLTIDSYYEVGALWKEYWYLKIASDCVEIKGEGYYPAGSIVTLSAPMVHELIPGEERVVFIGWTGSIESNSSEIKVVMNDFKIIEANWAKQYYLEVKSDCRGVYGSGWYDEGSNVTFYAESPISSSLGVRYVFTGWSDGVKESVRTITINDAAVYTAIYKKQYLLTILSPYGSPKGQGWYDEGGLATFSIEPMEEIIKGKVRVVFAKWSDGLTPWSANNSIYMFKPITISAEWKRQYWLEVDTSVGGTIVGTSGWYEGGSRVTISAVPEYEPEKNRHKFVFNKWISIGENFAPIEREESPVTTVVINNYYEIRAEWREYWYLRVESRYGTPEGEGYYPAGSTAEVSVDPEFILVPDEVRMVFIGWTGSISSNSPSVRIFMNQPKFLKAEWKRQYYLKLISKHGGVYGSGWYDENSTAKFYAEASMGIGWGTKLVFDGWNGDYVGSSLNGSIVMDGAKTIIANWRVDQSELYANLVIIIIVIIVCIILVKKGILPKMYKLRKKE